jgi:transcriptional regulator with XRE-family HTH domain
MIHRLKEVRKELGLNQTDFAKYLGITQTAYSMIENGNRPLSDKYSWKYSIVWFRKPSGFFCLWRGNSLKPSGSSLMQTTGGKGIMKESKYNI